MPRNVSVPNRAKYMLARSAILRHLQANLHQTHSSIEVHIFPSVRSQAFLDFLKASGVYFVMAHDGANAVPIAKDLDIQKLSEDARLRVERQEHVRKTSFRAMICYLIIQGYNVALINGLEWQDTKVNNPNSDAGRSAFDCCSGCHYSR